MEYSFEKSNIPNRPRGRNMPYSLMQNEPIAPAAGSSPYSP